MATAPIRKSAAEPLYSPQFDRRPRKDEPLLSPEFMSKLEQLEILSRKIFIGRMKGERRSKKRGESVEFADYRNYVVGDDLRFLDWNIYARLEKLGRRVRVEADAKAELSGACKRCLAPISVDVPVEFELTLVPADEHADDGAPAEGKDHDKGPRGGSFSAGDAEEETYTGKVIDLDPIVREQILLAMPEYPVCDEKCKGLCPVCGANLNDRECGCDRHVPDPRWAGLKNVKL